MDSPDGSSVRHGYESLGPRFESSPLFGVYPKVFINTDGRGHVTCGMLMWPRRLFQ